MIFSDNLSMTLQGIYFTMTEHEQWLSTAIGKERLKWDKKRKSYSLLRLPCAFDTETTNWFVPRLNRYNATMYIWQFGLNGAVIVGRTWGEFEGLVKYLREKLELSKDKMLCCYVHNLDFDSQFFRKHFDVTDVFALEERKAMSMTIADGIIFKCSYVLTGKSLASLSEDLKRYKVAKLAGDLDYTLRRHSGTPITEKEMGYCLHDVAVIMAYIQEQIEIEGNITRIPLTKTGYVRRLYRNRCLYPVKDGKADVIGHLEYKRLMDKLIMTAEEYQEAKKAYAGGYTHASVWHSDITREHVASFDFSSSYPAVMVSKYFPMSRGRKVTINCKKDLERYLRTHCCVFILDMYNVQATYLYEHYILESKCAICDSPVRDNGRVISAKHIMITVTELDYEIIKDTYKWDSMRVGDFYIYERGFLPKAYIETTLELYSKKTTLKGVPEKAEEYRLSKELINSAYGMLVTDICRDEIAYDKEWFKIIKDRRDSVAEYNESESRFISYLWGVYVCAHARHNLWYGGILKCGEDYIYSDTDSIKILNYEKHMSDIMSYNDKVDSDMKRVCDYYGFEYALTRPKTIKGVEKPLGHWDFEGVYDRFKTVGCKRYLTEKDGKIEITIAGVGKINGAEYLMAKYKTADSVFEHFTAGLKFPKTSDVKGFKKSPTGKLTHRYIDGPTEGVMTDYLGNKAHWREESSITLEPAGYDMSITAEYFDLIANRIESIN